MPKQTKLEKKVDDLLVFLLEKFPDLIDESKDVFVNAKNILRGLKPVPIKDDYRAFYLHHKGSKPGCQPSDLVRLLEKNHEIVSTAVTEAQVIYILKKTK